MKIIDLYSCSFFISEKNSEYTMTQLDGEKGKGLALAYEHTTYKYVQLQRALATTIELLSYSSTARELISTERWGMDILQELSSDENYISVIKKEKAKHIHEWDVESITLQFLLVIFFSYNTLYTWDQDNTKYNYTCLLKDFKKILITEHTGKISKNESIDQETDNLISDFCLYRILKGTVNVLESHKDKELLDVMEYIEAALKYFHEYFMSWGDIISSLEIETQFDILRIGNFSGDIKKNTKRYLDLNEKMKQLSEHDVLLIKHVVEELFSFEPTNNFEKKIQVESEQLGTSSEERLNVDTKPLDFMKYTIKGSDKDMVLKIINQFPIQ